MDSEFTCPKCGKPIEINAIENLPIFPGRWIGYSGCPSCYFLVAEHRYSKTKDEAIKKAERNLKAIMSIVKENETGKWVDNEHMKEFVGK